MAIDLLYQGPTSRIPATPLTWDTGLTQRLDRPEGYLPDPGLVKAVNAALLLGQPLLLTGEPGVGKSQLAFAVAHALGLGRPGEVFAKSNLQSADLFYRFDHMRRLFDYQAKVDRPILEYLTITPLGRAILLAGGPSSRTEPLPGADAKPIRYAELLKDVAPSEKPRQSVVLIDEIDKAPRDVPNDILNEMDRMLFDIPEIGQRVSAPRERKPLVVMTSNSEKNLPDPFLRRCVFYHIPFPEIGAKGGTGISIEEIVASRIDALDGGGKLLDEALELFRIMRDPSLGFDKPLSPSELLNWLLLLVYKGGLTKTQSLRAHPNLALDYLSILLKTTRDQGLGQEAVRRWLARPAR